MHRNLTLMMKIILNDIERKVMVDGETTKFKVKARLRQGYPLSMCLFNLILEEKWNNISPNLSSPSLYDILKR